MEPATPFDLDSAMGRWRDLFAAKSSLRPTDLLELESHVVASIDDLIAKGLTKEEAFLIATRRLGDAGAISHEFEKINPGRVWMIRGTWMLIGVFLSDAVVAIANFVGTAAFIIARNTLPIEYLHIQRVVGVVAMVSAGYLTVWLMRRVVLSPASRGARLVAFFVRRPFSSALALAVILECVHAINPSGRISVHGVPPPNVDRSLVHVWLSFHGWIYNLVVDHRPFGTGQLIYAVLQYSPQIILITAFTLLVLRNGGRGRDQMFKQGVD